MIRAASPRRLRLAFVLALLAAALTPSAASFAGAGKNPAERVQTCLDYIQLTVKKAEERMAQQADKTAAKIEKLATKGAPDDLIANVASHGKRRIDRIVEECSRRIETRGGQCIDLLSARGDEGGEEELINQIVKTSESAYQAIDDGARKQKDAINKARDEALDGGKEG